MGLVHPIVGNNEFPLKYRRQGQAVGGCPASHHPLAPAATTTTNSSNNNYNTFVRLNYEQK